MVTVAIPVLDGAARLGEVLSAVREQELSDEVEILVCDSGSSDGSAQIAAAGGARVIEIAPGTFHHARTRNLLVEEARGEFVAMLTQDATPASTRWLSELLRGFTVAERVGLVYGPYRPRPGCPPMEATRLHRFFGALNSDGGPRVDRLEPAGGRALDPSRGYFTDANGCIRRAAWEQVPFPAVPYAEDHALAAAMLRAGWAKVFMPDAAVLHSHHYSPGEQLRRSFDDFRGLREVYGHRASLRPRDLAIQMRGAIGVGVRDGGMAGALADQALTLLGGVLGSRADRLPAGVRRRLSREHRESFAPVSGRDGDQRWT